MSAQAIDSKAYFVARLKALGLDDLTQDFERLGWTSMGSFAFSANYVPGRADEGPFIDEVVRPLFQEDNPPRKAMVRRLFFEAYSLSAADMNRKALQPDDDDKPKKMPLAERAERFKHLEEKLVGLSLRGPLEPSNTMVDKFAAMEDTGAISYLKWEEYTTREKELEGKKKEELFKEDAEGRLQRTFREKEYPIQVGDELAMKYALQRRGLAMNMAKLINFQVHDTLVNFYLEELARVALPGYEKVSMEQIRRADKEIFLRMADKTRSGLSNFGDPLRQVLPLDQVLPAVMVEPRIVALLFPLPSTSGRQNQQSGNKRKADEVERLRNEVKKLKAKGDHKGGGFGSNRGGQAGNNEGASQSSRGKGGGGKQRSAKVKGPRMPMELVGMASEVGGKRLCYAYNLKGGCIVRGVDGCAKGAHICAFPGCGGDHSLQDCSKKH